MKRTWELRARWWAADDASPGAAHGAAIIRSSRDGAPPPKRQRTSEPVPSWDPFWKPPGPAQTAVDHSIDVVSSWLDSFPATDPPALDSSAHTNGQTKRVGFQLWRMPSGGLGYDLPTEILDSEGAPLTLEPIGRARYAQTRIGVTC